MWKNFRWALCVLAVRVCGFGPSRSEQQTYVVTTSATVAYTARNSRANHSACAADNVSGAPTCRYAHSPRWQRCRRNPPLAEYCLGTPSTQPAVPLTATTPESENTSAKLHEVLITANLNQQLIRIAPSIGADTYVIGANQIQNIPGGENAPFQQVLLRTPGVVEDSFGQVHLRGEHSNLTYRVDGVLLPASVVSLGGFGRGRYAFVESMTLIDGSLPAQFGFRTAAIVDITTKTGSTLDHNEVRHLRR